MLPETATFDGFVENMFDLDNRVRFVLNFSKQLEELTLHAGRWKALLALEMHETGRSFSLIAKAYGVSRARADQLVKEGRDWRAFEAQADGSSAALSAPAS